MFTIVIFRNGRERIFRFDTLNAACIAAQAIFAATGIVVGIKYDA